MRSSVCNRSMNGLRWQGRASSPLRRSPPMGRIPSRLATSRSAVRVLSAGSRSSSPTLRCATRSSRATGYRGMGMAGTFEFSRHPTDLSITDRPPPIIALLHMADILLSGSARFPDCATTYTKRRVARDMVQRRGVWAQRPSRRAPRRARYLECVVRAPPVTVRLGLMAARRPRDGGLRPRSPAPLRGAAASSPVGG
jgi:hypothetical protein